MCSVYLNSSVVVPLKHTEREQQSRPILSQPNQQVEISDGGRTLTSFFWGRHDGIGTASYWIDQTKKDSGHSNFMIGKNLAEEIVACILGGYGVKADIALSAFQGLKEANLIRLDPLPSYAEIEATLCKPIRVGGSEVRYRFPRQRGLRIVEALKKLASDSPPDKDHELRSWLLSFNGIGLKTASWIVRNFTSCSTVAIIDVHIRRAGVSAGLFHESWQLPKDYLLFEEVFLAYAWLGGVNAANLDACMWGQLASLGRQGIQLLPSLSTVN